MHLTHNAHFGESTGCSATHCVDGLRPFRTRRANLDSGRAGISIVHYRLRSDCRYEAHSPPAFLVTVAVDSLADQLPARGFEQFNRITIRVFQLNLFAAWTYFH